MIISFIIFSTIISVLIFFAKNNKLTKVLSFVFLLSLSSVSVFSFLNLGQYDSLYFKFDSIGVLLSVVLTLLSFSTFYHSYLYLKRHDFSDKHEAIYYSALIMLIAAMISAYFAENIAVLWVSIETTTLFVSLLIFHERTKEALEAAWKYLFVSSVGVAIAFIGILFLSMAASSSGVHNLSVHQLIQVAGQMNTLWLKITFLLVLTGFSAKMGLFPLHTVAVDAHTVAPPPISAFISTSLMNVGFLGIFRIFSVIAHTDVLKWAQNVLFIAGVLSILMASVQLSRIKHYKRMFAFSSLEHMGIVAIGLGVGGLGYYAAILHLVFHSFVKASLFYQIGQVHQFFHSYWIKDAKGYFKKNAVGALAFLLGVISILAIPPSGLFISEFLTFKALFINNHLFIGVFVLVLLTIIIYYFAKKSFYLLYDKPKIEIENQNIKINPYETISQFVFLFLVIYLGINPPVFFTNLIQSVAAILN